MKKPGAEDVRRAMRKSSSKKVPKGADEGASIILSAPKRLCIREAMPPVPKKPRTKEGALGASERSMVAVLGKRGKASLAEDGVVDLTVLARLRLGRIDEEPARPSTFAATGPSYPESSRPSGSAPVPAEAGSQGPLDAEFLRDGTALGDPATAIALFQSILLPADVEEVSQCSLTEISNFVFLELAWVSCLILLSL